MDGSAFAKGEVLFEAYFMIDKIAAEGLENGTIPVDFEVLDATFGEDTLNVCTVTAGSITIDTVYEAGDVNGEGMVTNVDVIMVARHIVHLTTLTDAQIARADVDGSGDIENSDLIKLARKVVER